jgi:phosphoribosylformylglycinamidine synthase
VTATSPRVGVVTFPGSLDDRDAARAVMLAGAEPVRLWHGDPDLQAVDAVVLPGGFSYGDYLRAGAIARFSPVVGEIIRAGGAGLPVLGICNGFQVLCEARLLPGALIRNSGLHFVCRDQRLRVESTQSAWTHRFAPGEQIVIPVKHGEGRYVADPATLDELESENRVAFRYVSDGTDTPHNPNGALNDIAGIRNEAGNVVGLMPHPEHAIDDLTGPSTDGLAMFAAVIESLVAA